MSSLSIERLSVGYVPAMPLLENVRFSLHAGEICLLLGANGSGKSCFLSTLTGVTPPIKGEISPSDFSYLPQPLEHAEYLAGSEFVQILGVRASEDLKTLPAYSSKLHEVSRGQAQYFFTRAVLERNTRYHFLDEPFSNLDNRHAFDLSVRIKQATNCSKSFLISVHKLSELLLFPEAKLALIHDRKLLIFSKLAEASESREFQEFLSPFRMTQTLDRQWTLGW